MRRADRFVIPPNWKVLFKDLGIDPKVALKLAGLPISLFEQAKVQLSPPQYFQLWEGIDSAARAQGIDLAIKFSEVMSLESFDVPIFAAICSPNLNSAVKRLQEYKPLIGPMKLELHQTDKDMTIEIRCYGYQATLPKAINLTEAVFFTQLARLATRQHIKPRQVTLPELPDNVEEYHSYFGCPVIQGEQMKVVFSREDAYKPFLTNNQTMLGIFENEIQKKLEAISHSNPTSMIVYGHLMDMLPQGESSIDVMASHMAMSKRTLQRKLSSEGTSYKAILHKVREELAHYYLKMTELPLSEVSFLLGFQETNSFVRAYSNWTGTSPGQVRSH